MTLTNATVRFLIVLPLGSRVHIIGKIVDSVQVEPRTLHRLRKVIADNSQTRVSQAASVYPPSRIYAIFSSLCNAYQFRCRIWFPQTTSS